LFTMLGGLYMLLVPVVNVVTDQAALRSLGAGWIRALGLRSVHLLTVSGLVLAFGFTAAASAPLVMAAAGLVRTSPEVHAAATDTTTDPVPPVVSEPTTPMSSSPPTLVPGVLSVGAYDPSGRLDGLPLDLELSYVPQADTQLLIAALAHAGDRVPLITLEPRATEGAALPVLERVVSGNADGELMQLAHIVRDSAPRIVLIRWAHEMDLHLLYPWSASDPALYRAAFRHVVEVFRAEGASNALWVWSPAGQGNALAYYPGGDVVDYVGLTLLGDAGWDAELGYATRQSAADLLRPRYAAVEASGKPIIIAELGVSGMAAEQTEWLSEGARALSEFPLVEGVVYFNDRNAANNWRLSEPDWRLQDARALDALRSPHV
jgi:endoglucanase